MKRYFNITLTLVFILFVVTACTKDTPQESLLTSGTWKVESRFATVLGLTFNVNDSLQNCVKDDLTRFKTDNNVEIDDGPTKCDPSDPQTYSLGPWILSENDTKLTYGGTTYEMLELTENRLKLFGPYGGQGVTGTVEVTFVK